MSSNSAVWRRRSRGLFVLGLLSTFGIFFVNIMGFVDTYTGSTMGCGPDWPLCNGQLIPTSMNPHTLIEFGHRAIVGLVSFMLLFLSMWAWLRYRRSRQVKILVLVSLCFVAAQAFLGAMAVFFVNPPAVLALHFGFSLLAFSGVLLLTVFIYQSEYQNERRTALVGSVSGSYGKSGSDAFSPLPKGLKRWFYTTFVAVYAAVYYGAYVSSTGSGEACTGWPLCSGHWFVPLQGSVGLAYAHRLVAIVVLLLAINLVYQTRSLRTGRPDVYRAAILSVVLVVLQGASGAYLVLSDIKLNAFLLHVSIMSLLFGVLSYLVLQALNSSEYTESFAKVV
ncbi:COX15/CtaA family protein [Alicyclobacillus tolerans]|uniref:COX15/CtaA family protein n=1 Tax=Alicyclobacillus tolerans TaxID=90970 RepID=UPI001F009FD6|nr:COX15/CtaA family protein [Alicyclobacillus tolerans]MCF8565345.1 COX15/CtaA family protein [Alicyclobacillus tolerans]